MNIFSTGFHGYACGAHRFESGSYLLGLGRRQHARMLERRAPRNTRPHINLKQPPIKPKRIIKLRKLRISGLAKPATPQIFLTHI